MTRSPAVFLVALAVVASCGGRSAKVGAVLPHGPSLPEESPVAVVAPPPRDDGRLPPTARPLRYALSLRIDPKLPRFSGATTIQVELPEPTSYVVLHARDMNVSHALARVAGSVAVSATATTRLAHGGVVPEELVLAFARPIPAGPATIEIVYDAPFAADLAGLYRVEEGGRSYAYTQFEVADARRAFPCFDEPGFKTPYDVAIASPPETIALTNSPEASREDSPDGTIVRRFATSRPLPSYLVAFAVGDFDVVQWRKDPFPIRAVTTKGRGNLTGLALETATALVERFGDYFAFPYAYPKLDLVGVPDFAAGAMENPGLVTFRDTLLLLDPAPGDDIGEALAGQVIAHELAHQWLGDLVTMKWWDDIWLNEGFATWAEAKIVDAWKPSFGATLEQIAGVQHVMDGDALRSARAVRGPVRSTSEAEETFDGIAYDKGAAVLRMIEGWLGPEVFRRGVQRYLSENAWKSASADDLFKALDFVSTRRVGQLASGFLDQSGVPDVLVNWTCDGGAGKVELSESEWRPLGIEGDPRRGWTLPVCVGSDTQKGKSCFTLGRDPIARDLGAGCPSWVYPNSDGAGYYRFVLEAARLMALARNARTLSPIDRLGLVSNTWAEVRQGAIGASVLLDMLPAFDTETNRYVVDQIAHALRGIDVALVDTDVREAFQHWVAARMAGRKASLGWEDASQAAVTGRASEAKDRGQDEDDRAFERRTVLWVMGELANDGPTLNEAQGYAEKWLKDPTSVTPDTAAVALPLASMKAGPARLYQLRAAAANAKTPEDRVLAIRAMGTFDDPALLRKALDLTLTGDFKLSELGYLFGSAVGHRVSWPVLYAWEKENWAKLRARLPGSLGRGMLIAVAGTMCTPAERDDARDFFVAATQGVEGVRRQLEETLESAGLCIAMREHGAAEVGRYLGIWGGGEGRAQARAQARAQMQTQVSLPDRAPAPAPPTIETTPGQGSSMDPEAVVYRRCMHFRAVLVACAALAVSAAPGDARAVGTRTFELETLEQLSGGNLAGVSVGSDGVVRAGWTLGNVPLPNDSGTTTTCTVTLADGSILIGTGPAAGGKVVHVSNDRATVFADTKENAVSGLAVDTKGTVYAATTSNKIYRLSQGKAEVFATLPDVDSVLALAVDRAGTALYAATGSDGRVLRVDLSGASSTYFKTDDPFVVSLAVGDDGVVYAGTSSKGLLYRITAPGRATVLYDFPGEDVHAIAIGPNRTIWAIVNEAATGGGSSESPESTPPRRNAGGRAPPGPAAAPRSKPGKGSLWRLDARERPERLMHHDEFHYLSLALDDRGMPYVGTGAEGRVYTVDDAHVVSLVADTDERQISALSVAGRARFVIGSDPAAFHRVLSVGGPDAVWTSKPLDAGLRAHFGHLSWNGTGSLEVSTRTGDTQSPDTTWSVWTKPLANGGAVTSPAGRFIQVRAHLRDPAATIANLNLAFVTENLRAVVTEIAAHPKGAVHDSKEGLVQSGSEPPKHDSVMHVTWKVDNPDSDELRYHVQFHLEGEARWLDALKSDEVLTKSELDWDTAALPEGKYRVRVDASDDLSNPLGSATHHALETPFVLVDNTPPVFKSLVVLGHRVRAEVVDGLGPIARIDVAIDGRLEWRPLAAADGIFDTADETIDADITALLPASPGPHVVAVRAYDAAGNFVVRSIETP